MYTCMYMHMYRIKMYCTIDCVHEISVYRYRSKIVYHDTTSYHYQSQLIVNLLV